jgi:hypothetical protein
MNLPRFTTRNILFATTWVCIWFIALANYQQFKDNAAIAAPLEILVFACPFLAIASVSRTIKGFFIGVLIAVAGVLAVILFANLVSRFLA